MAAQPSERSRLLLAALAVFLVALVVRFGHLAALRSSFAGTHLFSLARGDAAHHWNEAREILDRDPWLRDRVPWKGPGYSYFLAGLMALFGRSPGSLRWPLAALGALNCAALVLLARRILPLGSSVFAGLLAALSGVLVLYDAELYLPTLLIALSLPVFALLGQADPSLRARFLAGVLLGLAAVVHAAFLLPAAALALGSLVRRPAGAAVLFAGVALAVAPLALENRLVRGQPILVSWNGGINLYAGNQPAFDQYSGNGTQAWQRILESPVDAGIERECDRDRLYRRLAAQQAAREPLRAAGILLHKAWILLSPVEYASNIGLYELRAHSPILALLLGRIGPLWWPFGIVGPLALIGIVLAGRRPSPLLAALGLWSAGLALGIVLSFNTARYRAPLVFFSGLWVALALQAAHAAWTSRDRPRLLRLGAAFVALSALLAAGAVPQRKLPLPLEWDEAAALMSEGAFGRAELWIRKAIARAPGDPEMLHAAASFYARSGRRAEEREQLQALLALPDLEPDMVSIGHTALAESLAADGRLDEARSEIREALAVHVDDTSWRGVPYYPLGLGPVTACRLKLEQASIELAAGAAPRAAELMAEVRSTCPLNGRIAALLADLEVRSVLAAPRLGAGSE